MSERRRLPIQFNYFEEHRNLTYPGVEPNVYIISESGNVINIVTGITLCQHVDRYGYVAVYLRKLGYSRLVFERVHRLVAWEFCLDNRDINLDVNHIDGNKQNNHYTNLEWCNRSKNNIHAIVNRLRPTVVKADEARNICQLLQDTSWSYRKILDTLGYTHISEDRVSAIKVGEDWWHISKDYDFSHRPVKHSRNQYSKP